MKCSYSATYSMYCIFTLRVIGNGITCVDKVFGNIFTLMYNSLFIAYSLDFFFSPCAWIYVHWRFNTILLE